MLFVGVLCSVLRMSFVGVCLYRTVPYKQHHTRSVTQTGSR